SRKLLSRAHKKVKQNEATGVHRKAASNHSSSLAQFVFAIRNRDMTSLHELLSEEITFYADGGDKIKVVKKFSYGIEDVASLLIFVHEKFQQKHTIKTSMVNHQPALLYYDQEKLTTC